MVAALIAWGVSLLVAMGGLIAYKGREGPASAPPERLPDFLAPTAIDAPSPTLLLFIHPKCPCTTATIRQLERVMALVLSHQPAPPRDPTLLANHPAPPHIVIVAAAWEGPVDAWVGASTAQSAKQFPGARLLVDHNAELAGRLGITTSGHVLLYDASRRLSFSGGITPARGHEGPNAGATALAAILTGAPAPIATTPTYGCPLIGLTCNVRCP